MRKKQFQREVVGNFLKNELKIQCYETELF